MDNGKRRIWNPDATVPVKNKKNGTWVDCQLRRLDAADLPRVLALYDLMVTWSAGPENFWRYPDATVAEFLDTRGIVAGAFVKERLIGFRILYFHPENDPDNRCAIPVSLRANRHLAVSAVDHDFFGNSLQIRMSAAVMNWAQEGKTGFSQYLFRGGPP